MSKAFRSAAARAADTAVLDATALQALLEENPIAAQGYTRLTEDGDVAGLLGRDEWIKYFTTLPHRAARRLADEGTVPNLDARGRRVVSVTLHAGTLQQIKLEEGILDWHLSDETGINVPWVRSQAVALLDGIAPALRSILQDLIGNQGQSLDAPAENEDGSQTTEGEG